MAQLIDIKVDNREISQAFTAYSRDQKKIMKRAYRKGANIITKTARKLLKSSMTSLIYHYGGKSVNLSKGIRTSIFKDGTGVSIYERSPRDPYFILLFHDAGAKAGRKKTTTQPNKYYHYTKKGGIKAKGFFQSALA